MNRREALKSTATFAAVASVLPTSGPEPSATRSLAPAPSRGAYIDTPDGQSLFYKDSGSGRPVVFLGAWALPSDMWQYQMTSLSEQGLRCVAYDRRGHGRSSQAGTGYDYDTLADDLAAVLDTLDLRDVVLVGMSMAPGEMVRYLTRHGARRIARLVFVGTAATPFPMQSVDNPEGIPAERFEYFRRHILLRDFPTWIEENRPPFVVPDTPPQIQEWVRTMMLSTSMKAVVECNRCSTETDFRPELPGITLPTLVIHGDKDVSAPLDRTGRPTAKMIPGAALRIYEGAPHGLFVTHMARLTQDLLAFAKE